jgi:glycosyltransferase involved in cell wall biosynthesis
MTVAAPIGVFVLTKNEAPNLSRVLDKLQAFSRVVVLDSGSTDETQAIAERFNNVEFHTRAFDSHANQCNYALDVCLKDAPWVMSLDADYVLSDQLVSELTTLDWNQHAAYEASFVFCMDGTPLPGSFYPPRVVLFRKDCARYVQIGHTQKVEIQGSIGQLQGKILHDDRKDFAYVLQNQKRYAALEAQYLQQQPLRTLKLAGKLRKTGLIMPILAPIVALLSKGSFLVGKPAWKYAYFRLIAELEIAKAIWRLRLH